ncbi:hypothetical protein A3843_18820 [Pseudovibrio exalbescens]|uniref:Uncharacterized protein n=1 Tax=Pseudovibrio exalbescens TaxID=197461 RepID=A0A1U7JD80_9HYPH|nr:hypothetical protein A3843_18820 [Pseudovibrio exalbescens]
MTAEGKDEQVADLRAASKKENAEPAYLERAGRAPLTLTQNNKTKIQPRPYPTQVIPASEPGSRPAITRTREAP